MATVNAVQSYLATLDPSQQVMVVALTREDFNEYIIQGNGPEVPTEEIWTDYLGDNAEAWGDDINTQYIDFNGDDAYSDWIGYVEEFSIMVEESDLTEEELVALELHEEGE